MNTQTLSGGRRLSGEKTIWLMAALLVLCIAVSVLLGRYTISPAKVIEIILGTERDSTAAVTLVNIRLPRVLLAVIVGAGLSAAGAAFQGVFQNPMAAQDILGASSGAGLGAALAIFLSFESWGVTAMAFVFSILTIGLVLLISKYAKGEKLLGLILSGIVVSSLAQSGTSFIKLVADPTNKLPAITYWLMGSIAGANSRELLFAVIPTAAGIVPLLMLRWKMNILALGDDEAKTLGVNASKLRAVIILCATLITAATVSVAGVIGWVGLVVPHLMRRIVGSDYRYLMPASVIGGGIFLLIVDDLARILTTSEIPIGILTSFVGAPFFIFLIVRRNEWR